MREQDVEVAALVTAMAPRRRTADGVAVGPGTDLAADLGYDSVRLIELAIALEQRFALPPLDESAPVVRTVADVVAMVEHQRGRR